MEGNLRLPLIINGGSAEVADVFLEAPPAACVADLVKAITGAARDDSLGVYLARRRTWFASQEQLGSLRLCAGDRLTICPEVHVPGADELGAGTAAVLCVIGGPDSGASFPLSAGELVIGRDDGCDVALNDSSLSGRHAQLTVGATVRIRDLGSKNGTIVEGVALESGIDQELAKGSVAQLGRSLLVLRDRQPVSPDRVVDGEGTIPINRPPRVASRPANLVLELKAPPGKPRRVRIPFIASLAPVAIGVALWLMTKNITMLLFSALTPVMMLSTFIEDKRGGKKQFVRDEREFRERLVALKNDLDELRVAETARRRSEAPDVADLLERARGLQPDLWERRPGDGDFLTLRVGAATRESGIAVQFEKSGDDELKKEAEDLIGWYSTLPHVPVSAPLVELGVLGVCGDRARANALTRWLLLQAAALHSPRDLAIVACLQDLDSESWGWLKWLPHTRAGFASIDPQLAQKRALSNQLIDQLLALVSERKAQSERTQLPKSWPFSVLVLIEEDVTPERARVRELLEDCSRYGVYVIWLGEDRRALPGESRGIIELDGQTARLRYTRADTGEVVEDVTADGLDPQLALSAALALAPVRDVSALRGSAELPPRVSLLDLLRLRDLEAETIVRRWQEKTRGLDAEIGVSGDGAFSTDLRTDGPHTLLAGTTGSGKSELLQTLIASLALAHPPNVITFLLIDYKGGAAFKECVRLPHTVGLVTDLDAHLTERVLQSLNAELRRREHVLRAAGAKDLIELDRVAPDKALASLVIVIDEFAALAKEVPDFVQGVVDIAQRGRSLGVHLILATQRPAGVVSENIRANSNLRIALRVNEAGESSDVIGVGDAAQIPRSRPGRAFIRTGHSELAEIQTAYVGGISAAKEATRLQAEPFDSSFFAPDGAGPQLSVVREGATDLARIVDTCLEAAELAQSPAPHRPWLEPLANVVPLEEAEKLAGPDEAGVVIGVIDEPELQSQRALALDLDTDGSILVFGTGGSGKTTLLRTIAASLAQSGSPADTRIYGLDFASRGLATLETLPHCGSVVPGEDVERVERLFSMLARTLATRRLSFAGSGAASLAEYRTLTGINEARLVVLLDGYGGFVTAFERINQGELVDALPRLVADGRSFGIHFIITAGRRGGVPGSLTGVVQRKLVLRMADEDDYASLGVDLKRVRGLRLAPGRGFADGEEFQCSVVGTDASGDGQVATLAELGTRLSAAHGGLEAPKIELLPTAISGADLPVPEQPLQAVIGIGSDELEPFGVDISDSHFVVAGPYRSGRSATLAAIVNSLRSRDPNVELHLLAPRRSPLTKLDGWQSVAAGVEECDRSAAALAENLDVERETVIVIDDATELLEIAGAQKLEQIVRRGRDGRVRVVASAEIQSAHRAYAPWFRELLKEENGLLLDPQLDIDGELFGVRLPRATNAVFPIGRGYAVFRGVFELVQVASP
ncbi:MAG: FtsK/SpoIIIE domain-containing protein [Gaiellaceae bacterium]